MVATLLHLTCHLTPYLPCVCVCVHVWMRQTCGGGVGSFRQHLPRGKYSLCRTCPFHTLANYDVDSSRLASTMLVLPPLFLLLVLLLVQTQQTRLPQVLAHASKHASKHPKTHPQ